jgi:hypothetical protein
VLILLWMDGWWMRGTVFVGRCSGFGLFAIQKLTAAGLVHEKASSENWGYIGVSQY